MKEFLSFQYRTNAMTERMVVFLNQFVIHHFLSWGCGCGFGDLWVHLWRVCDHRMAIDYRWNDVEGGCGGRRCGRCCCCRMGLQDVVMMVKEEKGEGRVERGC